MSAYLAEYDLEIVEGSTFKQSFVWETSEKVYRNIASITQAAPCIVETETAHGLTTGWRAAISAVEGMTQINADYAPPRNSDHYIVTAVDDTHIELNSVNAALFDAYEAGGVLEYYKPVDLTGFSARMHVRESVESETILLELTTENGRIIIDEDNTILIELSEADTSDKAWVFGVYSLELVSPGGEVTPFAYGMVTLTQEITREDEV